MIFVIGTYVMKELTVIWMGFLGVRFEVGGVEGVKLPSLKLVRVMLET